MALKTCPDSAVLVVENARLENRQAFIASAFLERFVTDAEPLLSANGTGKPVCRRNDVVAAISTNLGRVSEDLMNRGLPIHLDAVGDMTQRQPKIGNPKLEYLPENNGQIAAELRGMVERWKNVGRPLDKDVRHPFTEWARTIGGLLHANGFSDFLANYGERRTTDDPIRWNLRVLGATEPDSWHRASEWAQIAVLLGLHKSLLGSNEQDSAAGRARGMGVVLSNHRDETLLAETESARLTLRLKKSRKRWEGGEPHVRYQFEKLKDDPIPEDKESMGP